MRGKKHRNDDIKKSNENTDEQLKNSLFSEADAKSVEVSGYTLGYGAPQIDESMEEHTIPTGVVDIDKSVTFPTSSSSTYRQHKLNPNFQSDHKYHKEHVRLPPITRQHYPYEYYPLQSTSRHSKHLPHIQPINHRHQSFHHHHHYHNKHVESYDPRWWYMPMNSVHTPKSYQFMHHHYHHYKPPKWYEIPSRQ